MVEYYESSIARVSQTIGGRKKERKKDDRSRNKDDYDLLEIEEILRRREGYARERERYEGGRTNKFHDTVTRRVPGTFAIPGNDAEAAHRLQRNFLS